MAYHNGVWESDRETRRRNEQMWNDHRGKGQRQGNGHDRDPGAGAGAGAGAKAQAGPKDDDLSRAIRSEHEGTKPAQTGTGSLAGAPWKDAGFLGGTKIDRPTIPGGCKHTGGTVSITLANGKRLYGAKGYDIKETAHLDLIIDCAGILKPRSRFVAKATAPRFRSLDTSAYPDVITLAWPDMTAPTQVGIKFWIRLKDLLPMDTAICCMGSHGRTGTALAALLVADGVGADDAMKRVRKEHCPRAIETREQESYIRALAKDRDTLAMRQRKGEKGGK